MRERWMAYLDVRGGSTRPGFPFFFFPSSLSFPSSWKITEPLTPQTTVLGQGRGKDTRSWKEEKKDDGVGAKVREGIEEEGSARMEENQGGSLRKQRGPKKSGRKNPQKYDRGA